MTKIYMDNNATTRMREEVLEAMLPYYKEVYGNASSMHQFGRAARRAVDEARARVASLIGAASAEEIIFTSGGTEADNFAIKGIAYALRAKGTHIITTTIEHHAVLNSCKFLEREGFEVTYVGVDGNGIVRLDELAAAITEKTALITVMWANNEVGAIQPVKQIGQIAAKRGIIFHTDAVQAAGKIPVDVSEAAASLLSLSSHKIHGPKGVGALYVKKGTKVTPLFHGGHQEMNKRAGTENVAGLVGFGVAAELAKRELDAQTRVLEALKTDLYNGIVANIRHVRINGSLEKALPNTLNMGFKFLEGEGIILNLDLEGVAVSTGSACTSGSLEPSHVLTAMGVDPADAQGSIRFSLSRENTKEDVEYLLGVLPAIIKRLREMSPLYDSQVDKNNA